MDISHIDPATLDLDSADALAAVGSSALEGVPVPAPSGPSFLLDATVGTENRPVDGLWVARDGDRTLGYAMATLPARENTDTVLLRGSVAPEAQGGGIGRALLAEVLASSDRRVVACGVWSGTAGEQALPRLGFQRRSSFVVRRLDLAEPQSSWPRLRAEAEQASGDYELVRFAGSTPVELLDEMAKLREAINDAPSTGTDYEAYDADRISTYETSLARRRQTQYLIAVRHRGSGEWAGLTICCVDEFMPSIAFQEDTSVVRAHRGHRLGILLKLAMIEWLRDERPEVAATHTWNAKENHHMIAVNERLGLVAVAENVTYRMDR